MSAYDFTDELRRRGLLAERLMARLREKMAESARPLSARAVAKFLVQKQHLSQQQATDVLNALIVRGVDVDAAPSLGEAAPTIISDVIIDEHGGGLGFAPFLKDSAPPLATSGPSRPPVDDDELTLAKIDEEEDEFDDVPLTPIEDPPPVEPVKRDAKKEKRRPPAENPTKPREPVLEEVVMSVEPLPSLTELAAPDTSPKRSAGGTIRLDKGSRGRKKPQKRKSDFDSPLMLVGGGALVLLILCGIAVFLLLRNRSGEETLQLAKKATNAGDYRQAIELYDDFLTRFKGHSDYSLARVQRATLLLRRDVEANDLDHALSTAQKEISDVEQEEKFAEVAHPELAALLPRIAQGFANRADAAASVEDAHKSIDQANVALELTTNARYIPEALRNQAQLDEVKATLARIERRQQTQKDLDQALADIAKAIETGDTNVAYAAHRKLIVNRPELASEPSLVAMVAKTTDTERERIHFVSEEKPAETTEMPTPWLVSLALAQRRPGAAASAGGEAVCVRVEGALYGLDLATGKLLWRRYVGIGSQSEAAAAAAQVGGDVIVTDATGQGLLRLNATTGELRWRQSLGEPCAAPVVVGDRAYLAAASGRLHIVDLSSGARKGYVEFAQALGITPAADRQGKRLYLTGERASLYCLSLSDMSCLGVYYLGHSKGSVRVAPAATQSKLAVLENDGVETCRLRLLSFDEKGMIAGQVAERRLSGQAASPPLVAGRRVIVVTDRGQLDVYDIGVGAEDAALSVAATREATDAQPLVRHVAVADRNLWIGDRQLTKHEISPAGNRLPVVSLDNDYRGATFDHPLQIVGRTLVHVIRPKGKPGFVAAGMDTQAGRVIWETSLAVPPAGPPIVDPSAQTLTVANASGAVFRFDSAAIRSRVLDQPLPAPATPAQIRPLSSGVDLGGGKAAFSAVDGDRILLVDPAQTARPVQWVTLPGPLACPLSRYADGLVAPLALGQVLYLNPADGKELATSFQPRLEPGSKTQYLPPGVVEGSQRQFVITDGREKIYLVGLTNASRPQLQAIADPAVGPDPIVTQVVVLGESAMAVTKHGRLVRFQLPSLAASGETQLSAPVVWGPYLAGDGLVLATATGQLMKVKDDGKAVWTQPIEQGEPIGPPLVNADSILIAYRHGLLERRSAADGNSLGKIDVAQSVDAGPVSFVGRIVLTTHDGTLLIVDQP